jgi:D-alanyl-D-alanine carboxypeptidase
MDAVSGKILWGRASYTPRYPASTTKILTTLLLLENVKDLQSRITAGPNTEQVTGSSLHLKPGETISAEDAAYAMMLRSANDACVAVAQTVSGSVVEFSNLMNQRALEIGCQNSNFRNPNGLPDPSHKTTAYDLALIAREAMRNETFRTIAATKSRIISRSVNQTDLLIKTRNKWLLKDATADGIKTGYTNDAGHCYVGSAVRKNFRVITVILNSESWQDDHKTMLEWAFKNYQIGMKKSKGEVLSQIPVKGGVTQEIPVAAKVPVQLLQRVTDTQGYAFDWPSDLKLNAPVKKGETVGTVLIRDADGFRVKVPLIAAQTVPKAQNILKDRLGAHPAWYAIVGGMLGAAWIMRRRTRHY